MFWIILVLLPLAYAEPIPDYDRPYSPIVTDRQTYSWTDKVRINIIAPSWNTDRHMIDEIGADPGHAIKISTRGFSLDTYRLAETDANSGIFAGEVILTGFLHDVDGDGEPDTNPRTSGGGPTDGLLQTDHRSALTVSFEFADGVVVTESVPISWSVGTVQFIGDAHRFEQGAVVRVSDPDMNLNPESQDRVHLKVYSGSDAAGLDTKAIETGPESGVFEAHISFSASGASGGNRLFALPDDVIHVEYEDRTLPAPYGVSDTLDIRVQLQLVPAAEQTARVQIQDVFLADGSGNPAGSKLAAGQRIQIVGQLDNAQGHDQPFAYLVQVRDRDGIVVGLSWMSGILQPGGTIDVSQSWLPAAPGTYSIESFVWESVPSMIPVAEPRLIRAMVT